LVSIEQVLPEDGDKIHSWKVVLNNKTERWITSKHPVILLIFHRHKPYYLFYRKLRFHHGVQTASEFHPTYSSMNKKEFPSGTQEAELGNLFHLAKD
jgi:hypothetical protein